MNTLGHRYRKLSKHTGVVTLLFYFVNFQAFCQQPLTLTDAIDRALKNNQQIAIAANDRLSKEKARAELSTSGLPQVKVGLSTIYAPTSSAFGYDPALSNGGQVSGQLFLQQSLFDGGARSLKSDQFAIDLKRANIGLQVAKRNLRYDVTIAFIDVLRYRDEIEFRKEHADQLREYTDLVRRRFQGGGTSQSDVLRSEVELSNASVALSEATTLYNSARYSLTELMGGPIDTSVSVSGMLANLIEIPPEAKPGHVLELEMERTGVERSALDVRLIDREALPVLSLYADAGMLSSLQNLRLSSTDRSSILGYSVGVTAEFPVFDWGGRSLRREQKELEFNSLTAGTTLVERRLQSEAARTRLQLHDALRRFETLRENAAKAKDVFLLTRSRYAAGNALAVEVLGAQQLENDSALAALQTLAEIQSLSARLIQLMTEEEE